MKWIPYGPHALLFQFAEQLGDITFARGRAIATELEEHPPPGLVEFVSGFTSVLVEFDPRCVPDVKALAPELAAQLEGAASLALPHAPLIKIPVIYNGPDLERVAQHNHLTIAEVCDLHAAPVYKVYLLGFTPGFPYLGELDPRLHTPRRTAPRSRVPANSVAIGGAHTGIYSVDGPGGWNVIGHTTVILFDPKGSQADGEKPEMFLLQPGDRVKFVPVPAA